MSEAHEIQVIILRIKWHNFYAQKLSGGRAILGISYR
jgi:hypothetical protein